MNLMKVLRLWANVTSPKTWAQRMISDAQHRLEIERAIEAAAPKSLWHQLIGKLHHLTRSN